MSPSGLLNLSGGCLGEPKLQFGVRNDRGLGDCSLTLKPQSAKADDWWGQWLSRGTLDLGL